jgi:hypothetical protein
MIGRGTDFRVLMYQVYIFPFSGIHKQKCLLALLLYPEWRSIPLLYVLSTAGKVMLQLSSATYSVLVIPVPCEERSRCGEAYILHATSIALKLEKQEVDVQCIGCERCERCETHRLVLVCFGCKRDIGTSISTTGCPESVARRKGGRWRTADGGGERV